MGHPHYPARKGRPIVALADVLTRFGPVEGESDRQRAVRHGAGGLALYWRDLPVRDQAAADLVDEAIEVLARAAELVVEAVGG